MRKKLTRERRRDRRQIGCVLCGGRSEFIGVWRPVGVYRRLMGKETTVYSLCGDCRIKDESLDLVQRMVLRDHLTRGGTHVMLRGRPERPDGVARLIARLAHCESCGVAVWIDGDALKVCQSLDVPAEARCFDCPLPDQSKIML